MERPFFGVDVHVRRYRIMVKIILLLASLAFASLAHSATPTPDSVEKLLADTRAEKMLDAMLVNVDQSLRQSMAAAMQGRQLSPEQQRVVDEAPARFVQVLQDEMT
jgi:hypothetical protein